ncbi:MAG: LytR/AlgR family response regulator transcription factor [Flavobacteriaceae bacterium]
MEKAINILIVEDNVLIADDLQMILEDMGYTVAANVTSYEKAIVALKENTVDLALLDIQLATEKSGIDIGKHIRDNYNIPFVFVTSNSDKETLNQAKEVKPNGYLVKPFEEKDLYTTIEITMSNFQDANSDDDSKNKKNKSALKKSIFVKDSHLYRKIIFKDILYIKSDNVYIEIYTTSKTYVVRSTLKDFLKKLPQDDFLRTSKSYIINIRHVQAMNSRDVIIDDKMIPVSKEYKPIIQEMLNI